MAVNQEEMMFRKSITSTFDDPNGGQAEFERHRAEAA